MAKKDLNKEIFQKIKEIHYLTTQIKNSNNSTESEKMLAKRLDKMTSAFATLLGARDMYFSFFINELEKSNKLTPTDKKKMKKLGLKKLEEESNFIAKFM